MTQAENFQEKMNPSKKNFKIVHKIGDLAGLFSVEPNDPLYKLIGPLTKIKRREIPYDV